MDDLVKFLRDRLDEDERAAGALVDDRRPGRTERWEFCDDGAIRDTGTHRSLRVKFTWPPEADHITRHDPARILADIEAKRRLLDIHAKQERDDGCVICDAGNQSCGCMGGNHWSYPCDTLKLLALPYADHEAYREDWRP